MAGTDSTPQDPPSQPPGSSAGFDAESEGDLALARRRRTRRPRRWRVLLHNDDYTTMDFVVSILKSIFGKDPETANRMMLQVHHEGFTIAGIYPYEIAETKAAQVLAAAQANEFPFLATLEPE